MMTKVVMSSGSADSGMGMDSIRAGLVQFLRSLGFVEDPATAPSHGIQHCASDYLGYSTSALAGIAIGYIAVHELGRTILQRR
jgi:hypothetical protein